MYSDLTDAQALDLLKNVTLPITNWAAKRIEDMEAECERIRAEVTALQELGVWMTGCGYDFSQHEYFVANRERLSRGAS